MNSADYAYAESHWVRITLTDAVRPEEPMRQIRHRFPNAITLDFVTRGGERGTERDLVSRRTLTPVEITEHFVTYVTGREILDDEQVQVRDAVEAAQQGMVSR
jgi:exonuclease SbcD